MSKEDDPRSDEAYKCWLEKVAEMNGFDGCTGVADFHKHCCMQHDFAYRTGLNARSVFDFDPKDITRREADNQFRRCNLAAVKFKWFSPMAYWRWLGVRAVGWALWGKRQTLKFPEWTKTEKVKEAEEADKLPETTR